MKTKELKSTLDQLEKLLPEDRLPELNECRKELEDPTPEVIAYVRAWIRTVMTLERIDL